MHITPKAWRCLYVRRQTNEQKGGRVPTVVVVLETITTHRSFSHQARVHQERWHSASLCQIRKTSIYYPNSMVDHYMHSSSFHLDCFCFVFLRQPNARGARGDVVMRLWRLLPPVEGRLKAAGYDLTSFDWCGERRRQGTPGRETEASEPLAAGEGAAAKSCGDDVAEHILGCEIYWSRHGGDAGGSDAASITPGGEGAATGEEGKGRRRSFGAGVTCSDTAGASSPAAPEGASFVGLMGEDDSGTWVQSQNVAGLEILVKDDLRIWSDRLWVNDRGFDRSGNFVYGNQRGVPYKMRRVVASGPLAWTLGERHRTKETYAQKMSAIGVDPGQRVGPPVRRPTTT